MYITDSMNFNLRGGEGKKFKLITALPSGSKLTLLGKSESTGYSKVQTNDGVTGYILSRFLLKHPVSRWRLDKVSQQATALKVKNKTLKTTLKNLRENNTSAVSSNESLIQERDHLSTELTNLRQTAENTIQIQRERNELQERVVISERELQQLKREKQALEDNTNQDWFMYGGLLSFAGIFIGLLITRISWPQKSYGHWDTF